MVFFLTLLMILECTLCGIKKLFIPNIKFLMIFFFFFRKDKVSSTFEKITWGGLAIVLFNACLSCISVFGTEPDMIRDGSTIPIAKILQDTTQKSVIMLPLGAVDDGEHSQNEKINR